MEFAYMVLISHSSFVALGSTLDKAEELMRDPRNVGKDTHGFIIMPVRVDALRWKDCQYAMPFNRRIYNAKGEFVKQVEFEVNG